MKNISLLLLAILSLCTLSCDDDIEDRPVIELSENVTLDSPFTGVYVLNVEDASNLAETFTWSGAVFTDNVVPTYSLEGDIAGNNFENALEIGSTTSTRLQVSVETLNSRAIELGIPPFEEGLMEIRLKTELGSATPVYSEEIYTLNVTPYAVSDPVLYLVGAPQAYYGLNGWDNTTAIEMNYIGDGTTKVFEAFVKAGLDDGIKFIGEQGTWDSGNFGLNSGTHDGTLIDDGGSSDIKLADNYGGAGLYYIKVDIDDMSYETAKMDWGIIGAATPEGWDAETPLSYVFNDNMFTLTTELDASGDANLKFRAANAGNIIGDSDWFFNIGTELDVWDNGDPFVIGSSGSYSIELQIDFNGVVTITGL